MRLQVATTQLSQSDDVLVENQADSGFSIGKDLLLNFCVTTVVFLVVQLVLSHASLLGAAPIFSDDFDGFGSTLSHIRTSWFRPLSTVVWSFLCALGPRKFFCVSELWVAAYIALVFSYTKALFGIRVRALPLTVLAATTAVCFEYLTHYFYFSGAILGIMSGSLAVGAMLIFVILRAEKYKTYFLAIPVMLAIASLLCKEDFALPLLLFFCFQLVTTGSGSRKKAAIVSVATGLSIASIFVLQKIIAPSQFFSGQSAHYEMGLSLSSILAMYQRYLFCTRGAVAACVAQILGTIWILSTNFSRYTKELILLNLQTLSLIGPFSLLPNHFFEYYAVGWICLQASFVLLFALPPGKSFLSNKWICTLLALAASCAVIFVTQPQREALLSWYGKASTLSSNEDVSLRKYREEINRAQNVVIIDPPTCNAWLRTDGSYLRNRLGLQANWKVFAERDSELGKQVKQFADLHYSGIDWQIYDKIVPVQA